MSPNFGSTPYASAFQDLPIPDVDSLRQSTLDFLSSFDNTEWYENPMISILKGEKMDISGAKRIKTKDAFGNTNGYQYLATPEQVEELQEFIKSFDVDLYAPQQIKDLRTEIRAIEKELLTTYAGYLIGTQCLDFGKQDGITELEEATMANVVEGRLNDLLLQDEIEGKVVINRAPIFVSCVSNFTLFLDLFRKTIRSLELGIPCVILGRSNTSQHHYRWTELLVSLMKKHTNIPKNLITFLSLSLEDIKRITQECSNIAGNLYATCSRTLAKEIKQTYPNIVASTGGPNTMIATDLTADVADAIRMSASIESSGQCTALRHCILPRSNSIQREDILKIFDSKTTAISSPADAVKKSMFDGIYKNHKGSILPPTAGRDDNENGDSSYFHLTKDDVYIKINDKLPQEEMNEYWRKVVVDFTQLFDRDDWLLSKKATTPVEKEILINPIADWLNREQPITLAINASSQSDIFALGILLFENTGLVVYTVGSTCSVGEGESNGMAPGLTCQARPQEGEIFGELPPRMVLSNFTRFPVVVPSSTPSYDTCYTTTYLNSVTLSSTIPKFVQSILLRHVKDISIRGYCYELLNYLKDATEINPKPGVGSARTSLWGLQRPPIHSKTLLRCSRGTTFDILAPVFIIFLATNAHDQYELSLYDDNDNNAALRSICEIENIAYSLHNDDDDDDNEVQKKYYNVVTIGSSPMTSFPMVGQYLSLYMNLGHIKSTKSQDEKFVQKFSQSVKWLKLLQN